MDASEVQDRVARVAADFAANRQSRQLRRSLDPIDFQRLAEAGFLLTGVSEETGGLWVSPEQSTRLTCDILRTLAKGDPSVALVSAMHPAVLAFWLCTPTAPKPFAEAWADQRRWVTQAAIDGRWWGTITSEPGSGGDVFKTKSLARRANDGYELTGQKHFGSGSGITSYMITTALPEGEADADWFFVNVENAMWDGSQGLKLISEWDGHGMIATQSHAFDFTGYPTTRMAWPNNLRSIAAAASPVITAEFCAVIVGVVQAAFEAAQTQIFRRRNDLRPFEQVEWAYVENEAWLMEQAYEGVLKVVEARGSGAGLEALHAKTAIAGIAESLTARISKLIGGGTFHRASPFGWAFEDVRALGFLRPPWSLAFDSILQQTWTRLDAPGP